MKKCVLVLLLLAVFLPLNSAELKGVKMEDSIEINGKTLNLNGMALRKKVFFKVYVAGLYLPEKCGDGDKILKNDTTRHMVMHFMRSVSAGKINGAWYDGLKANTPDHSPELKKQFDTLADMMEKVSSGDRLVFTYVPGAGTQVKVKGVVKGSLPGKSFADALFACWIGKRPGPGESFKSGLLGGD